MPALFGDEAGLPRTSRFSIPYEVESLSVKRSRIPRGGMTTVNVRVKATQATDFEIDMVGQSGWTPRLVRDVPNKNPLDPTQWCTRVEQIDQGESPTGQGGPDRDAVSGWPVPKWQRYRCTFEGMSHKIETQAFVDAKHDANPVPASELHRYVIRSMAPQSKEQQFPGGAFRMVDADPDRRFPLGATGFRVVVYADVQYQWLRIPVDALRPAFWRAYLGRFNTAVFDDQARGGYAFPAETLLYCGYDDTDKYFDAAGDWVVDVVHTFKFRQFGWNTFLNNVGEAVEVSSTGNPAGGTKLYSGADFNDLFRTD